ncbi:MAG: hypothetical protein K5765_04995, partial [Clostridia bacterium]|nr:hypothetical protein [Clostridia bacterium]
MNQEIKKERKVVRKDVILLCAIVFLAFIVVCAISVFNSSKASAINKVDDTFSSINKVEEVVDIPNEKIGNQLAIEESVEDANIDDSEINDSEKDNTEIDSTLDSSEDCLSCPPENSVIKEYTIEIGSDMDVTDVLTEYEIAASNGNWEGTLSGPNYTSLSGSYYSNERSNSTSFSASASSSNSGRWGTISCSCSCYIRVYVRLPSSGILRTVINNGGQLRVRSTFSGQWGGSYWGTGDDRVGSSWGGRTLGGDASASASKWTAIVKVSVSCSCSLGGSAYVYWSLTGNSSHGVGSISWSNTGGNVWANNRTATVTVS